MNTVLAGLPFAPDIYNAREHGLQGDGHTNDQPALAALVERLGPVHVFRYVDDMADGGDSQSGVRENASKLAREIDGPAVLIGYSMGGAIIRTYLALHRSEAEHTVSKVIFVDAVASGSWGYAFARAVPSRVDGSLGDKLSEVMRSMAQTSASVNFDRPATRDLSPRSALFRRIAPLPLPRNIDYYTFWGDIRITFERRLLVYHLPSFNLPSMGDLGLLPGDPDPRVLPELGGQRFSPQTDDTHVALDVPHRARVRVSSSLVSELIRLCGQNEGDRGRRCKALIRSSFDLPDAHTAVPQTMGRIFVDEPRLGGRVTVLQAIANAVES